MPVETDNRISVRCLNLSIVAIEKYRSSPAHCDYFAVFQVHVFRFGHESLLDLDRRDIFSRTEQVRNYAELFVNSNSHIAP